MPASAARSQPITSFSSFSLRRLASEVRRYLLKSVSKSLTEAFLISFFERAQSENKANQTTVAISLLLNVFTNDYTMRGAPLYLFQNPLEPHPPQPLLLVFSSCHTYTTFMSNSSPLLKRITINPEQCGGRPCIRGMRIRVVDVLGLLAAGLSHEQVLEELPDLEPEDITASLTF